VVVVKRQLSLGCLLLAAVSCSKVEPRRAPATASAPAKQASLVFKGMCDASGAVVLGDTRFAVADDEDNVLRVYDSVRGGEPLDSIDVSAALELPIKKKTPEADIEAATRVGDRALWITSHGLRSSGKPAPARVRFFATTAPSAGTSLTPVGSPYHALLDDMLASPQLARFDLAAAAKLAPKAPGGLNLEGMTRRVDGSSVWIGFRNPRPEQKALVVPLLNPLAVIGGARAELGEPQLLDLGGLGIRSLSLWRSQYLIIAGAVADEAESRLFRWDGKGAVPRPVPGVDLHGFNPEAFVSRDEQDQVLLLSDDGSVEIDGLPCKKLADRAKKQFRGVWVRVES
jgi:hypothetical protein